MYETILSMLLFLQPFHTDVEAPEARADRMAIVAASITQATEEATCIGEFANTECKPTFRGKPEELAIGLFTIAKFETRFAVHVHEDKCKPWECDAGQAKGLFQVHVSKSVPMSMWRQMGGTSKESTLLSARAAAALWSRAWHCGTMEKAFSGYITSRCQKTDEGSRRAKDYQANLTKYRSLIGR